VGRVEVRNLDATSIQPWRDRREMCPRRHEKCIRFLGNEFVIAEIDYVNGVPEVLKSARDENRFQVVVVSR
jgi:hypothetical protein